MKRGSIFEAAGTARQWVFLLLGANVLMQLSVLYIWNTAGQVVTLQGTSQSDSGLSAICMAGLNLWLCLAVLRSFPSGAPLRPAWLLMAAAAAAETISGMAAQILGSDWLLNPLTWTAHPHSGVIEQIRLSALIAGGPLRLALLAAAMGPLLRTFRKLGFRARPGAIDWTLPGLFCLFTIGRVIEAAFARSHAIGFEDGVSLAGLPVLCWLFFEAMLLRKSIGRMGNGLIGKAWTVLVYAIVLNGAGEVALWVIPHYSPSPAVFAALVRLPMGAMFALVPACVLAAQHRATKGTERAGDLATGAPALAP